MKAIKKIRKLRALAIAGSLSALAVPSSAIARPATDVYVPVRHENVTVTHYQLPPSFKPEVQTPANPIGLRRYTPPAGFKPEIQTPASSTSSSAPSSVILRTVTENGSQTLAIVLAALALAVALCGSAYAWFRVAHMRRDLPGNGPTPLVS